MMINQFEVPMYIEDVLPELSIELKNSSKKATVYGQMQVLLDYTCRKIEEHNLKAVRKCFLLAEKLYDRGNNIVRMAIENVFVYSFSRLPFCDKEEQSKILGFIPGDLYSVYVKQISRAGC